MLKFMKTYHVSHFDFIKASKFAFVIAAVFVIGSIASLYVKGLNFGIDFKGGILVEISSPNEIDMADVRDKMNALDLRDVSLQSIGLEGKELMIHASVDTEDKAEQAKVLNQIKSVLDPAVEYQRVEVIGPRVGQELQTKSMIACILALLAISIYIWFRFEWQFALATLISLAHNLVVVMGIFSVFGLDFNLTVIAGILSVAGYSTNDTIVTFDRVRENLKKYRKMPIDELLNQSNNETLSRTILTSITTILVLIVLLMIGGQTLQGFSICMLSGIFVGTFASLYLAVPMLRFFDIRNVGAKDGEAGPYGHVG